MDKQKTCEERVDKYLEMVQDDLEKAIQLVGWEKYGHTIDKDDEIREHFDDPDDEDSFDLISWINSNSLCFDYVEPGTWSEEIDYKEGVGKRSLGYWRYQIAWGGPQYEIRWYMEDRDGEPDKTLFWFLDWYDGASREPTSNVIDRLWEYLRETRDY